MTCRLDGLHPLDALYRSAQQYPGGIEALAQRMGVHRATMYNKLRQQSTTHRIGFSEELSELLFCLEGAAVPAWADALHALCWRHGHVAVGLPQDLVLSDDELLGMVCSLVSSMGSVAAMLPKAVAMSPHDFTAADTQIERAIGALVLLRERLIDARSGVDNLGAALLGGDAAGRQGRRA